MPISGPRQIYITGASGALGNRLMSLMNSSSSAVKAIAIPRDSKGCYVPALCEEEQSISHGENLRFVVHCGWNTKDRSPESQESCVKRTATLAEYCSRRGIKVVFVSSISARHGGVNNYGRAKFRAEQIVHSFGGESIRPGLILFEEPQGLQRRLNQLSRFPVTLEIHPDVPITVISIISLVEEILHRCDSRALNNRPIESSNVQATLNLLLRSDVGTTKWTIRFRLSVLKRVCYLLCRTRLLGTDTCDSLEALFFSEAE